MRRFDLILALGLAALLLGVAACGGADDSTPVACLDGAGAYKGALGDAPKEVKLSGEVPISDCLAGNQRAGDLATVGTTMVAVATELNVEARTDPSGDAALQLGYLLGAARRGAEDTEGIHADLIRRLEAAAHYAPSGQPLPPRFLRTYREGFEDGLARG